MIIYPAVILILLLAAFALVYRRAYLIQEQHPDDLVKQDEPKINLSRQEYRSSEINPFDDQEENFRKAEDLFKKKQYISAEKWYIEAVKKNPKNSIIFSRLGVIYLEQKNYPDAIESLNEALRLNPSVATNIFNLSYAYNCEGDKKEAINAAKKAIRLDPTNSKYKKWLEHLRIKPF